MNALILAAGYAKRLYPLTLNQAKPLLRVAGKPIIEWVADQLATIEDLETIYIVTNAKFSSAFVSWGDIYQSRVPRPKLQILNDGSTSDADKVGAMGDMYFALEQKRLCGAELLVVAGDNLFSHPLAGFADFARAHPATVGIYDVKSLEQAKHYNTISTNPAGILNGFEEKPAEPTSTLCAIALYFFQPEALRMLPIYLTEHSSPDQPGRFIQWLYPKLDIYTFPVTGLWYDVGSPETLRIANELFTREQQPANAQQITTASPQVS
jgi:glucose-1-phosphate thymidylyltransferase